MKLGFIGTGKISVAVVEGLCTAELENFTVNLSPRNENNSSYLSGKYSNVHKLENNQQVLDQSDIIFIALRPAQAVEVLGELLFKAQHTVISFIPLLNYADLAAAVSPATNISRAIPLPSVIYHNCPVPVYKPNETVIQLFSYLGQPLIVAGESELHTLWTLTGLITPYFDLLNKLSCWSETNGVEKQIAAAYVANLFNSLAFMATQTNSPDFSELAKHAATPNGMNEQAGKEIAERGAHEIYTIACNNLLKRFR